MYNPGLKSEDRPRSEMQINSRGGGKFARKLWQVGEHLFICFCLAPDMGNSFDWPTAAVSFVCSRLYEKQ